MTYINKNLGNCRACDGVVSKKAKTCPHCGQRKPYKAKMGVTGYFIISMITLIMIGQLIIMNAQTSPSMHVQKLNSAAVSSSSQINLSDPAKQKMWILESQDGIRSKLKDPGSAKFKDSFFVVWKDTPVVCGSVNSKNGMGGYGGFQRFVASGTSISYLEEEVADFQNVWQEMCQK